MTSHPAIGSTSASLLPLGINSRVLGCPTLSVAAGLTNERRLVVIARQACATNDARLPVGTPVRHDVTGRDEGTSSRRRTIFDRI